MVIGSLVTNIVADLTKWGPNLDKARSSLGKFVGGVKSSMGLVSAITAGTAAVLVKSAVDHASALEDTSKKLAINVEVLQQFQYAAEQAGVASSSFTRALGMLQKNIGKDADMLKAIGLDPERVRQLRGIDEQFLAVADAISRIKDPADQAAAAVKFFGRSGMELLPLIRQGSGGILEMGKHLQEIGGVASASAISTLEGLGDTLETLTTAVKTLKLEFVATFGPAIAAVVNGLVAAMQSLRESAVQIKIALLEIMGTFQTPGGRMFTAGVLHKFGGMSAREAFNMSRGLGFDTSTELAAARKELQDMRRGPQLSTPSDVGIPALPALRDKLPALVNEKVAKNSDKQTMLQQQMVSALGQIAAGGAAIIGGSIGG